uniref:Uncharacterized protein n=1 Tax=Tetranychus urticae TaxID=32264 RepID=T1KZM7_TETUR
MLLTKLNQMLTHKYDMILKKAQENLKTFPCITLRIILPRNESLWMDEMAQLLRSRNWREERWTNDEESIFLIGLELR